MESQHSSELMLMWREDRADRLQVEAKIGMRDSCAIILLVGIIARVN
jgi:hypothetical protein